ncbi:Alpha/beta hydrolase fold-1 [Daldinia bambusicola]|nr:Alpha/beta hydrolase fold-1 [Daldinia bambusicola]
METSKPAVIIVTGGFHQPHHYNPLKIRLEADGHEVFVPLLRSCGSQAGVTWKDDVALIHETVEPHMDNGKEFVVICHSYGGVPACAATNGLTVEERKRNGKKGGFRAILLIAAFAVPRVGADVLECFGGQYPSWMTHQPFYQKNARCFVNDKAKQIFYNDLPGDVVEQCFSSLVPFSQDSLETPVEFAAPDLTIPSTYLICENDLGMPPHAQETFAASIPGVKVERCSAGHSPFLSQPDRVVEVVRGLMG